MSNAAVFLDIINFHERYKDQKQQREVLRFLSILTAQAAKFVFPETAPGNLIPRNRSGSGYFIGLDETDVLPTLEFVRRFRNFLREYNSRGDGPPISLCIVVASEKLKLKKGRLRGRLPSELERLSQSLDFTQFQKATGDDSALLVTSLYKALLDEVLLDEPVESEFRHLRELNWVRRVNPGAEGVDDIEDNGYLLSLVEDPFNRRPAGTPRQAENESDELPDEMFEDKPVFIDVEEDDVDEQESASEPEVAPADRLDRVDGLDLNAISASLSPAALDLALLLAQMALVPIPLALILFVYKHFLKNLSRPFEEKVWQAALEELNELNFFKRFDRKILRLEPRVRDFFLNNRKDRQSAGEIRKAVARGVAADARRVVRERFELEDSDSSEQLEQAHQSEEVPSAAEETPPVPALDEIAPHWEAVRDLMSMDLEKADNFWLCAGLAEHYESINELERALPLYERALELAETYRGAAHSSAAATLNKLARVYRSLDKFDEARALLERGLNISESFRGSAHPETTKLLNHLVELHISRKNYNEARGVLENALTIREAFLGAGDARTKSFRDKLASLDKKIAQQRAGVQ